MPGTEVQKAELLPELDEDQASLSDSLEDLYFHPVEFKEGQEEAVAKDLDQLVRDAFSTRGDLDEMLARWNDMAEGIAPPKNFPWPGSSNLFVPITEIHLNNFHAAARQTLLKGEQQFYVRRIGIEGSPDVASKLERYLNFKCMVELPLTDRFSQLIWCAGRDGIAVAQIQWMVEKGLVKEVTEYATAQDFIGAHPTPEHAGLSVKQYKAVLSRLSIGRPVALLEASEKILYQGPVVTPIQLADYVMAPMHVTHAKYARLVGKVFTYNASELKKQEKFGSWKNIQQVIDTKEDGRTDSGTFLKEEIEGISRRAGNGEFVLIDGIHRYDLDGDGIDENYLTVYHQKSGKILQYLHYPYLTNLDCFVPVRLKKRPGRWVGRGICHMLEDINSEINTQHNQRIDSRTITTVPTFKARETAKQWFNPNRPDQRFVPGRVYYMPNLDDVVQFDIRPTDLGESLQEESTLMSLADQLTGSSQLRSGQETKADPRAPAAKVMTLLNQSGIRMDDYFEEIAGSVADNEGLAAIGHHILQLYYQFYDQDLGKIPVLKNNLDPVIGPDGQPEKMELTREEFKQAAKMKVQLAKTSSMQNPDAMLLKFMQVFSLVINDPLVGGRPEGRLALLKRLFALAREENPDQYLPLDPSMATQAMTTAQQLQVLQGGGQGGGKTSGTAPGKAPGAPGTTRPAG